MDIKEILNSAERGDRRQIARLITILENRSQGYEDILDKITRIKRRAFVLGVTGPPGVGKSSLISKIAAAFSDRKRLAIIMIDASSPFTGGSLLGNRLRLEDDRNVFVRSMATRGHSGGLTIALGDSINLLSYLGYDMIIVESVGAGQDETDILYFSDKVILVLAPGTGDQIQALKAGQMEIGDLVVLNKADKNDALFSEKELIEIMSIPNMAKKQELIKVSALTGEGIPELIDLISAMTNDMKDDFQESISRNKETLKREINALIENEEKFVEERAIDVTQGKITLKEGVIAVLDKMRNSEKLK